MDNEIWVMDYELWMENEDWMMVHLRCLDTRYAIRCVLIRSRYVESQYATNLKANTHDTYSKEVFDTQYANIFHSDLNM